jgi:hypothetical protein
MRRNVLMQPQKFVSALIVGTATEQISDAARTFEIFGFIFSFSLHPNHVFDI